MRVLVTVLMLALAGCAEYPQLGMDPFVEGTGGPEANTTAAPVQAQDVTHEVPVVTSIATTPYTAPVPVELSRHEGSSATLLLVAGPDALRCVSQPHRESLPTPAGFTVAASWTRCSLSANGTVFTTGQANALAADMPVMAGVPVEGFTWNMTVGRTLANNTGEHEEVLESVGQAALAAPAASVIHGPPFHGGGWSRGHDVCDGPMHDAVETLHFGAVARNGRAVLSVDATDFEVLDVEGTGPENATNATHGARWWREGGEIFATGPWAHESTAMLNLTIRFHGARSHIGLLAPLECPAATFVDDQEIPVEARALGVAAGWEDSVSDAAGVNVWLTGA